MADSGDQTPLVVLTTLPTVGAARAFVRRAVDERVVACGTILPDTTSIYRWEDAVTEETETVVFLKTRRDRWEALVRLTEDSHPYDVPELLALPVTAGLPDYLAWMAAETTEREGMA